MMLATSITSTTSMLTMLTYGYTHTHSIKSFNMVCKSVHTYSAMSMTHMASQLSTLS